MSDTVRIPLVINNNNNNNKNQLLPASVKGSFWIILPEKPKSIWPQVEINEGLKIMPIVLFFSVSVQFAFS